MTMKERAARVAGCRYVDELLPNAPWVTDRGWIAKHKINVVVHGSDNFQEDLNETHSDAIDMGILRTVAYTPGISTTDIIRRCQESVHHLAS